jgi:SM-20-related protein
LRDVPFVLDPRPDLDQLKSRLKSTGRVHIPYILPNVTAHAIYEELATNTDWNLAVNNGGDVFDLKRTQLEALTLAEREEAAIKIEMRARTQFQYLYDAFRVSGAEEKGVTVPRLFRQLFDFMNAEPTLQFMRDLTGDTRVRHINMKASRYRPGHFLTKHDDGHVATRLYAYVLNLTPQWRPDWGGLLVFHDKDGHVAEGFTPAFNAINIFKVPMQHSVTMVAPFAGGARYSFTGWMHSVTPGETI